MKKFIHRSIGWVLALAMILAQVLIPVPMHASAAEAQTKTIYFDNSGKNWSEVNVYTWTGSTRYTGEWPGSAMIRVDGNIYAYNVPVEAANIIFNDGSNQTSDMTIPTDGADLYNSATNTWSTYTAGSDSVDYYLFGYINGANYACEEDHENMGIYKFVDGTLTATFDSDSYVAVKTTNNGAWYMSNSYNEQSRIARLFNTAKGVSFANKLFVPGGVEVTFTLVVNNDDSLTLSYIPTAQICEHTTHDTNGVCPDCGQGVDHIYSNSVCTVCGKPCGHNWANGECTLCGKVCGHPGHDSDGDCTTCGMIAGHTFSNGACTVCGKADPDYAVPNADYYLIGYINGANYGCEEDHENLGQYKFVDGKLTATFESDSYVFLKTGDNANWYLTEAYAANPPATFVSGGTEKLFVPGGVELTFTLTVNSNGSLTLDYAAASAECSHSYTSEVTTAAGCETEGVKTYTCSKCGNSYTETIAATGHSYSDGSCVVCGEADPDYIAPTKDYYLVGYINGANYGCEEDSENVGIYKFVNGTLTATFETDSYVFIKTGDNKNWYMSQAYDDDGKASLYLTTTNVSEKVYVPGGVEVIFTLEELWDGHLILTYVLNEGCDHESHDTNGICTSCGKNVGHNFAMSACTVCGIPCTHSYTNGVCTTCGNRLPVDYYLFGYINGANYGCEEDAENMGEYKFVDGKLTVTFTEDSYVAIKTGGNGIWYMCEGYYEDVTSRTLYNADGLTFPEKMFVPGGVEVTFTLVVNNFGSNLVLSYVVAEDSEPQDSKDIKWQVTSGTGADSASTNLRLVSWVDSVANYSSVTFNVTINGRTAPLVCTTAYTAIKASGLSISNPAGVFGEESANYFVTHTIMGVPSALFDSEILVTVTWTDLEGNSTTSDVEAILISSDWA